jgi:hypothetical protein
MKAKNDIQSLLEILQTKESILPGSLSKITPKSPQKSSRKWSVRSYWYLTWKEDGKSRATYIPSKDVPQVTRGIENMKKVKGYLSRLAMENLRQLKEGRDVRKNR